VDPRVDRFLSRVEFFVAVFPTSEHNTPASQTQKHTWTCHTGPPLLVMNQRSV